MKAVIFDYSLKPSAIQEDKQNFDISNLNKDTLKAIANGRMFVFFEPQRAYMVLETGLIDYLTQFKGVIKQIDSGNFETFSVSCDWYSNSLEHYYDANKDTLKIREGNGNLFTITTKYKVFKKSFEKFFRKTVADLYIYYPELANNPTAKEMLTL